MIPWRRKSTPMTFRVSHVPGFLITSAQMPDKSPNVSFKAKLLRPAAPESATWTFVVLPTGASAKLPTRSAISVEGSFAGQPFKATLEPDGQGSHWLKVPRVLREAAGASVGDSVALAIAPSEKQLEPRVPSDLRKALAAAPDAHERWKSMTPVARRDWIQWIVSAKKAETRERRIATTSDRLASGKRRICCFDRSGIYSKAFCAPDAAE